MNDDDDKKQKQKKTLADKAEWAGTTVARIMQIIKWLKIPVVFWAAVIILIIFLAIGVIGFFISMPDGVLGWIADYFKSKTFDLSVSQTELLTLCGQLEEMGYDLEGYGFVEEITREERDNTEANAIPTKGDMTEVKSKYLEAYIQAEKKSYIIANIDGFWQYLGESALWLNYTRGMAAELVFDIIWPVTQKEPPADFKEMILRMYNYDAENDRYILKDNMIENKYQKEKYNTITAMNLRSIMKEIIFAAESEGYKANQQNDSIWDTGVDIWNFFFNRGLWQQEQIDNSAAKEYGNKLLDCGYGRAFRGTLRSYLDEVRETNPASMPALIYLDGGEVTVNSDRWNGSAEWSQNGKKYEVTIDKEKRYFILGTTDNENLRDKIYNILGLSLQGEYAYDLNNWTCKYGKTTEFLLAMHLATQAPDFTYQFATAPAIDTKVHVKVFPIDVNFKFVIDEDGKQTLEEIIQQVKRDYAQHYRDKLKEFNGNLWVTGVYTTGEIVKLSDIQADTTLNAEEVGKWIRCLQGMSQGIGVKSDTILNEKVIEILGVKYSWNEVFGIERFSESITTVMNNYQGIVATGTPYITKVVQHWYRNQYFTGEDGDLSQIKARVRAMLSNLYAYSQGINPENIGENSETTDPNQQLSVEDYIEDEYLLRKIQEIENLDSIEKIKEYVEKWLAVAEKISDKDIKTKMINEINAVLSQINNNITGTSYQVVSNPEPMVYQIKSEEDQKFSEKTDVNNLMKSLYIKETRSADLTQIHNPTFEDNSLYVRNLLKQKYYIYGKEPIASDENDNGTTTTKPLSELKMIEGRQYINGKAALAWINKQIEMCTGRPDSIYMLRDLKELLEDFEFDLENTERPVKKTLINIMPDYIPYTSWPSIYEKNESNCTKMIYKTGSEAEIIAPDDGEVTRVSDSSIKIDFPNKENPTLTLYVEIEQGTFNLSKTGKIAKTKEIGKASPEDNMIILKLRLFSATKQILKVEDYMEVKKYNYNVEPKISNDEKIALYNLQNSEIEVETQVDAGNITSESNNTNLQRIALISVVLNKIASPFYEYSNISEAVLDSDFAKYRVNGVTNNNLSELEKDNSRLRTDSSEC